jgi:hypothetical protein
MRLFVIVKEVCLKENRVRAAVLHYHVQSYQVLLSLNLVNSYLHERGALCPARS